MTLLALTAVICFGFAVYNLTCAFADIPTKRTSRMMLLARKQQGVKAEKLLDVYLTKIAGLIAPYLKLDKLKRNRSLWSTIARGQYEIVEGVCSSVVSPMMRQYRKIQLIDEQGAERTLLLSKSAKFQIGARYRFYFQSSNHPTVGNDYLDAALSTNSFLGYEALGEPAVQEEQAKENG